MGMPLVLVVKMASWLEVRRDLLEQRLLDREILGNRFDHPVAADSSARSSSKLPMAMRVAKAGSKKAAGFP
jgi:hypothetical protein